jgi:LmeA-like phospholipid-binding
VTQDKPDLGEQALSKIAEVTIANQLDEVEQLNVDIRTDPLKLALGEVDSVAITANSMVTQGNLRMETVQVNTGKVSINVLSAVFGKIELTQPTDAEALVVLTEADINRALASDYLHEKMQNLQLDIKGESVTFDTQQAEVYLPDDGKMSFKAQIFMRRTGEVKQLSATAIPCLREDGQRISLEEILSAEAKGLSLEFAIALFEKIVELLDLRNFKAMGISLKLKRFDIQKGKIIINTTAKIEQLPQVQ